MPTSASARCADDREPAGLPGHAAHVPAHDGNAPASSAWSAAARPSSRAWPRPRSATVRPSSGSARRGPSSTRNRPDGQRPVFRDSVVGNLNEFFERFRTLNVGSCQDLDRLVEQAQELVRGVTPQDLRDDDGLRRYVAAQMAQVQATLDGMLVDRPRRRIIRAAPSSNGAAHATAD